MKKLWMLFAFFCLFGTFVGAKAQPPLNPGTNPGVSDCDDLSRLIKNTAIAVTAAKAVVGETWQAVIVASGKNNEAKAAWQVAYAISPGSETERKLKQEFDATTRVLNEAWNVWGVALHKLNALVWLLEDHKKNYAAAGCG